MNQTAMQEDYLFDSLHAALTFAYRYSGQQYSPSILAQMMKGGGGSGKGLSGLDGAAQAGLIRGILTRLPEVERNLITAKFAADADEIADAMRCLIVPVTAALGTGVHSRYMVSSLVQRNFGASVHLGDLASNYATSSATMTRKWQIVRGCLKSIWERAEGGAYRELKNARLIP